MQIKLDTNIQFLKGVGPKMSVKLEKLGVETVRDLIFYFPRGYNDYTQITKIRDLVSMEYEARSMEGKTIRAKIVNIKNKRTSRRRFTITEAVVADETGSIKVVWFNQPYLEKMLKAGREIILNGKVRRSSYSSELQLESPNRAEKSKIVPVYPETLGISSYYISKLQKAVSSQLGDVREYIPDVILKNNQLLPIQEAIKQLHEPENSEKLEKARQRMAFDELFLFSLQKQLLKKDILIRSSPKIEIDEDFLKKFAKSLPFKLTGAQKKAAWSIIKDLNSDKPMNRLLNGDVGSGKTVVAAMAAALVVKSGLRVALMAPTEILTLQHYETLKRILPSFSISVGLVSGSKKELVDAEVVVGTHALISGKTIQKNLGLVIIDEQHRFGVQQREKLLQTKTSRRPHFLSMTATPIPRTMSLVVFADLDVSVIDEMPRNRKKTITKVIAGDSRRSAYNFIQKEIGKGHQAFVICPLIEEQERASGKLEIFEEDRKAVLHEYKKLNEEIFPDAKIAMLHGKMKSGEKEKVMADFRAKKFDILVSTSVVEVGVDIPEATIMMIENADRFGLAQLHQFRGRVGRSDLQSYCLLFSSSMSENARKRLGYMENIHSGFELAEKDLKLRGPGVLYGYKQSGFWDFQFASLSDKIMIEKATEAAKTIAYEIEKYPLILKKISDRSKHLE